MFTPKMAIALRTLNLLRHGGMTGWLSVRDIGSVHGVREVTLRALVRRGVVHTRFNSRMRNGDLIGLEVRLARRTLAILDAVRA
jgi:hypothetical protein